MDLRLPTDLLSRYKSRTQQARVCTEPWGAANLYCPACDSPRIESLRANTPAHDFKCPSCLSWFQLKSKASSFGRQVPDGAIEAMRRSIVEDRTPGLFLLRYKRPEFIVHTVVLIPHFAFNESMLRKRKPLSKTAQRANWVGCTFMLDLIPSDARIDVVRDGQAMHPSDVRQAYKKLRPLEKIGVEKRGWTLDVLNTVRSLGKNDFSLPDLYSHEDELVQLHPKNAHVTDKIRQQLQILRDLRLLDFLGSGLSRAQSRGSYRLR